MFVSASFNFFFKKALYFKYYLFIYLFIYLFALNTGRESDWLLII